MAGKAEVANWLGVSAAKLGLARRLQSAKGREASSALLAEGPQAVREALAWGDVRYLVVGPGLTPAGHELAGAAAQAQVPVWAAEADQMSLITDTVHAQGIVAVCGKPTTGLADLASPRLVLVLDQVRDPGNLGTLIRTADAFGADAVIATTGSADPFNPKAVRASVGSFCHLPIITGLPYEQVVGWAVDAGLVVLAAASGGVRLDDPQVASLLGRNLAWVVGNEAHGVSPAHLGMARLSVAVPMRGHAESLNVAAAAAICLYATANAQSG